MDRRTFVSLIPAALVAPAAASAGFDRGREEQAAIFTGRHGRRGGTLSLDIFRPTTFNPLVATDAPSLSLAVLLNATLVGYDLAEQRDSDGLARSIAPSAGYRTWTVELRRGIRWSDGVPFDADDLVFTFRMLFDETTDHYLRQSFLQKDGTLPRVEKLGSHLVRFTFTESRPLATIDLGSVLMLPKHKLETALERRSFATAWGLDTPPAEIVGLGPFRLARYEEDRRIVLERNYYYWKRDRAGTRLPYVDRVEYKIVPDLHAAYLNFVGGSSDLYDARPDDVDDLKKGASAKGYTIHDLGPQLSMTYLAFNRIPTDGEAATRRTWFRRKEFRKAVSYAVDRDRIVAEVFGGRATAVYSLTTPSARDWYDERAILRYPRDVERARGMLKRLGIEDRDGDGVARDSKGNRVEFSIITNSNNPARVAMATLLVEQLREVGIVAKVDVQPFPVVVNRVIETGEYDAVLGGWQSAVPPDPVLMRNILTSSGAIHPGYPRQTKPDTPWEAKIDSLLVASAATADPAKRRQLYAEVLRIWTDELPEIDLVAPHAVLAARNRVKNIRPSRIPPYGAWNLDELFLEERRGTDSPSPTAS